MDIPPETPPENSNPPNKRPALDEIKKREVIAILSVGCTRQAAAEYVGCHVSTITRTAERDPQFQAKLRQAQSSHEILHVKSINSAAIEPRYWRAAAWALERMHPDRYGPRRPQVITVDQLELVLGQFAGALMEELPDEAARERLLARLDAMTQALRTSDAIAGPADRGHRRRTRGGTKRQRTH